MLSWQTALFRLTVNIFFNSATYQRYIRLNPVLNGIATTGIGGIEFKIGPNTYRLAFHVKSIFTGPAFRSRC
jgi:hypothetical protein